MAYRVEIASYKHRGGTKEYEAVLASSDDGKYIVIKRWGKSGTFGQVQTERYVNESDARRAFKDIQSTREKNGYNLSDSNDSADHDITALQAVLHKYRTAKLDSADAITWLTENDEGPVAQKEPAVKRNYTAEVNSNWGEW